MAKIRGKWSFDESKMSGVSSMDVSNVQESVRFTSFGVSWTGMRIELDTISRSGVARIYFLDSSGTYTKAWDKNNGWSHEDYKIVDFGEFELTVSELFYAKFTGAATLISTLYSLKGAWMWRETVNFTESAAQFVNFYLHDLGVWPVGATYTSMNLTAGRDTGAGDRPRIDYGTTTVSHGDFSQINNSNRYINFGEEEQAVTTAFYEQFTANAIPYDGIRPTAPLDKVLVFYNGNAPIELAPGKGLVLPTRGYQMQTRLTVLAGLEAGAEVYFDGALRATLTGRQAHRLYCAGKGMNHNIAVVNTLGAN